MASINFINECKNRANANRLGKLIVDSHEITNSDNLQSFDIDSGCYVDGNIVGAVYAKCLKGQFIAVPDNIDLINKNVQAQIGVKYADLNDEYINMGKYIVERPKDEITANMSQITAYESLYTNLDSKYICNIDYSTGNKTLSDLYIDVCNQLGLTPTTTNFINSTIPITNNPFTNGEKNRTVLQTVAKIASSFVDVDNVTNKIDLCWLSQNEEPDYIFHMNDYANVEGGKIVSGPINCLIIKNSQIDDENVTIKDDDSIALYGEHQLVISEDYILYNADLRQQSINAIWNRVKGMKYVDCKLTTYYGKPFLKLGDKIRIYTSETDYFDTYILKHQFTYDGTFTSVIESPALTEQEIRTKQDISLQEALRNTQVKVDKQQGEIELLVEEVKQSGIPRYPEPPSNPKEEDIYLNTTDNIIYIYKDGKWNATSIDPSTLEDYWTKDETRAEIDINMNEIKLDVSQSQEDINGLNAKANELSAKIDGLTNIQSMTGGNNLFHNPLGYFQDEYWNNPGETFRNTEIQNETGEKNAWLLKNNNQSQTIEVKNGMYTISFMYKKLIDLSSCKVRINDTEYVLDGADWQNFEQSFEVKEHSIKFEMISDTDNSCYIGILMCNAGSVKIPYSNNSNETVTDTVKIGQGIEIMSSKTNTKQTQDSDGNRIINISTNEVVTEFTDKGTRTKELIVENQAQITGLLFQNVANQTWISRM